MQTDLAHGNGDLQGGRQGDQPFKKVVHEEEYGQQTEEVQTYLTHDNGGRPFEVVIREKEHGFDVEVYKVEFERCWEGKTRLMRIFADVVPRVFVARESDVPEAIKLHEDFYHEDGHVVVLELTPDKSIYIGGDSVYMFETLAKLERLESYIGPNDFPYPCVIDEEGNVYMFLDNKIIPQASLGEFRDSGKYEDYNDWFYNGKVELEKLLDMKTVMIYKPTQ